VKKYFWLENNEEKRGKSSIKNEKYLESLKMVGDKGDGASEYMAVGCLWVLQLITVSACGPKTGIALYSLLVSRPDALQ